MRYQDRVRGDGIYCYAMSRVWDADRPSALVVVYSPVGEGDGVGALDGCGRACEAVGFGGVVVGHLFARRGLSAGVAGRGLDCVGPENDRVLLESAEECVVVVAAWGTAGAHSFRSDEVMSLLGGRCWATFGRNRFGFPVNPVYAVPGWAPTLERLGVGGGQSFSGAR